MHDAHELCVFFADATLEEKTSVLLEVCSREPDLLLDIIRVMNEPDWKAQARALLADTTSGRGGKIAAIKCCRNLTGWTLKDSKDAVEAL